MTWMSWGLTCGARAVRDRCDARRNAVGAGRIARGVALRQGGHMKTRWTDMKPRLVLGLWTAAAASACLAPAADEATAEVASAISDDFGDEEEGGDLGNDAWPDCPSYVTAMRGGALRDAVAGALPSLCNEAQTTIGPLINNCSQSTQSCGIYTSPPPSEGGAFQPGFVCNRYGQTVIVVRENLHTHDDFMGTLAEEVGHYLIGFEGSNHATRDQVAQCFSDACVDAADSCVDKSASCGLPLTIGNAGNSWTCSEDPGGPGDEPDDGPVEEEGDRCPGCPPEGAMVSRSECTGTCNGYMGYRNGEFACWTNCKGGML